MSIKKDTKKFYSVSTFILLGLFFIGNAFLITDKSILPFIIAQEQNNLQFIANLTGNEEVPATNIISTGNATFQVDSKTNNTSFSLTVKDLEGITAAHIHNGTMGYNGKIIVTLFLSPSPSSEDTPSLAIKGNITNEDLEGPLAKKQMSDLISLMNNKSSYVNVHTEQNPLGAIRGQISNGE